MKRLLCKWIPVCAMGAVLCACGGGVADGDYVGAFKEYVKKYNPASDTEKGKIPEMRAKIPFKTG